MDPRNGKFSGHDRRMPFCSETNVAPRASLDYGDWVDSHLDRFTASYMSPSMRVCNYTTESALLFLSRFPCLFSAELTISPSFRRCSSEAASTGGKERRLASVGLSIISLIIIRPGCHGLKRRLALYPSFDRGSLAVCLFLRILPRKRYWRIIYRGIQK